MSGLLRKESGYDKDNPSTAAGADDSLVTQDEFAPNRVWNGFSN